MLLRGKFAVAPLGLFALICSLFLINQRYGVNLVQLNYSLCHLLFGMAFPLLLGYLAIPPRMEEIVPFRVFLAQVRATPVRHWPLRIARSTMRDFERGIPWSPMAGALWVLGASVINEIVVDPATNGIPFTSAYEHFVADMAGIGLFLLLSHLVIRRRLLRSQHPVEAL